MISTNKAYYVYMQRIYIYIYISSLLTLILLLLLLLFFNLHRRDKKTNLHLPQLYSREHGYPFSCSCTVFVTILLLFVFDILSLHILCLIFYRHCWNHKINHDLLRLHWREWYNEMWKQRNRGQWSSKGLTCTTDPTLVEVCPCPLWTLPKIRWRDRRVISHQNLKKTHNVEKENPFIVFVHVDKRKQRILLIVRAALTIEFLLRLHLFF